jgi:DNA replication and repair protein RecF
MILSDLTLTHFRSYNKRTIPFTPTITLIIGPNTVGKTNILEAIMMMATGKSFRADTDKEMIHWNEEVARINAQCTADNDKTKLEIMITSGVVGGEKAPLKKYLVNGVARRQVDFIGNLRAVLFWPEHLELVTDSPSIRRKYLDSVLVQVDREYRRNLQSYERGLRQRNRLLDLINEGTAHRHQLQFWDQLLIKAGGYITDKRTAFIEFINKYQFTNVPIYHLTYDTSVISDSRLDEYKNEEIAAKATLVGPHRDDIIFYKHLGKKEDLLDLSKYGSRGEQRLAILWLKLAELSFIEQGTGERPILLLDDIFSEFDKGHREQVLDLLGKQQTVITSAEEEVALLLATHKISADIIRLGV